CCFHPLNTPSGERVTDIAPPDHRDHRGAFFAWGNMSFKRPSAEKTGDFWGWGKYAPIKDRVIQNRELYLAHSDAKSADVTVRNDWMLEGEKVLDENTTALVHTADDTNVYDLTFRFKSDGDFTINQMAFTGFVVRCRKDGKSFMSNASGKVELPDSNATKPEFNWPAEDWYSYTIALESGKTIAAALIDHPKNPKSTWHFTKTVSFLNPCISALAPVTVAANKVLTLRYRVLTRDGEFPAGAVDKFAKQFHAIKSSA
ncbi:MAG TPA: DUF6807 family protein, partial [Bryobacteraceae bacterium]|nr:DUF6807 family protein [Bryobacteraceae bacterium]